MLNHNKFSLPQQTRKISEQQQESPVYLRAKALEDLRQKIQTLRSRSQRTEIDSAETSPDEKTFLTQEIIKNAAACIEQIDRLVAESLIVPSDTGLNLLVSLIDKKTNFERNSSETNSFNSRVLANILKHLTNNELVIRHSYKIEDRLNANYVELGKIPLHFLGFIH